MKKSKIKYDQIWTKHTQTLLLKIKRNQIKQEERKEGDLQNLFLLFFHLFLFTMSLILKQ